MMDNWDDYADGWDSDNDVRLYSEKAFESLTDVFVLEGAKVFDFGCGTGLLSEKLAPIVSEVVALDPSPKMISVLSAKKIVNVTAIASELSESLIKGKGWDTRKFDFVVASSVCAFVPDYEDTLNLLKSLLVPGGVFVQWDWLITNENEEHGFTEEAIKTALNNVGFTDITLSQPFVFSSSKGTMPVVMACGKNA